MLLMILANLLWLTHVRPDTNWQFVALVIRSGKITTSCCLMIILEINKIVICYKPQALRTEMTSTSHLGFVIVLYDTKKACILGYYP